MSVYPLQVTLTRGEITPKLYSRVDLEYYRAAVRKCENFLVLRHGGARKRSGTYFVREVKDSADRTRLIPFVFAQDDAYALEMGDQYFRFFKDGGVVISGGSPYEVATPYIAADVFDVHYTQSADVLYLAHRAYRPRKLVRNSATSWTMSIIDFQDGPYLPENTTATTLSFSSGSGSVTVTASGTAGINDGQGFLSTDVDRLIRVKHGSSWGWLQITAVASTTSCTATVRAPVGTAGVTTWRLGAWSDTTGWPARVAFYNERLVFGRTDYQPQTVWMSKAGGLEDFSISDPLVDDDAVTITILAGEVNEISFLAEAQDLIVGTIGAMRTISPATRAEVFSPSNVEQRRHSTYGASSIQPVQIGGSTIYAGYYAASLREFSFSFERDGYVSPELSILSEHILRKTVVDMAYAQDPDSIIWLVLGDGQLGGLTYERDQEVVGLHRQIIAGGADDNYRARVKSVCTIPGATKSDEAWLVVERTIGGAVKQYIEYLQPTFDTVNGDTLEDAFFVDCGLTYDGSPTSSISGLGHLEGEEVAILADGAVMPRATVTSGSVNLPLGITASVIHAGLPYAARLETLAPAQHGQADGAGIGRRRTVTDVRLDLHESGPIRAGRRGGTLYDMKYRLPATPMGDAPDLGEGWYDVPVEGSWREDATIEIVSDTPTPVTIRAILTLIDGEP